eukprot:TRINITY_DN446_c0_g1_i26.p1 TRINITY_DN446_c0_g1~~TRINITY_DN446_c0_g1_i26.p1  ORF type:complete len:143 (+),score=60.18 TRINITY_DN446_c0_g1_i26:244-672(+)
MASSSNQQIKSRRGRKGGNQPAPAEAPVELEEVEESISAEAPVELEEVEESFFKKIMGAAKGLATKAIKNHPIAGKVTLKKGKKLILNEEVEQSFFKKILGAAKGIAGKAIKAHPMGGLASGVLEGAKGAKGAKGGKKGKKL